MDCRCAGMGGQSGGGWAAANPTHSVKRAGQHSRGEGAEQPYSKLDLAPWLFERNRPLILSSGILIEFQKECNFLQRKLIEIFYMADFMLNFLIF